MLVPVLVLLYPVGIYACSTLYPQPLGTLLLVLLLLLLNRLGHAPYAAVAAGLVYGAVVLTIPSFMLLAPVFAACVLVVNRHSRRSVLRFAGAFVVSTAVVIVPWTLRNALVFDAFVPVSTNGGYNLLVGNNEKTRPNSGVNVDIDHYMASVDGLDEVEADAGRRDAAVDWVLAHPGTATRLYLGKLLNYFNFRNELFVESEGSRLKNVVMFFTYYPLLLVALVRLVLIRRYPLTDLEALLFMTYFGNGLVSALFFTRIRFRIPFDVCLILIDAMFVGMIVSKAAKGGSRGMRSKVLETMTSESA